MADSKVTSNKVFDDKRRALGDIHNKQTITLEASKFGWVKASEIVESKSLILDFSLKKKKIHCCRKEEERSLEHCLQRH